MQLIITDAWLAKSRALHLSGWSLLGHSLLLALLLMVTGMGLYHWAWASGGLNRLAWLEAPARVGGSEDPASQRELIMRANLDAMARKLGEMQVKLIQLESLGERVSGLAGINPAELKTVPGRGGALVSGRPLSLLELQNTLSEIDQIADHGADLLTVVESRLFEQKIKKTMLPTQHPVQGSPLGSSFGWRIDPFTGVNALHTGLDFVASTGTAIMAAAGGVVVAQEYHPAYGNMIEIDHGNDLVTRYAHASKVLVKKGDLVKRGQKIALVGTSGRSTGPHLHFEVLVQGVPQNPQKFLVAARR